MRRGEQDGYIILECAADAIISAEIVQRRFGIDSSSMPEDLNVALLARGVPESLELAEALLTDVPDRYPDGIPVSRRGTLIILAAFAAEAASEGEASQAAQVLHSLDERRH